MANNDEYSNSRCIVKSIKCLSTMHSVTH